ncbi:PucR family transcriptional regulator [Microbacterium sp. SS28]|uniref:PucR family transcriptional regulator n=1 Tax=Microbacterium sp. SS28 TaxID=2919948 RepID=UPI001FAB32BA|nr:PucR family transcriptional regulator [Microbacterium sp. SS28]
MVSLVQLVSAVGPALLPVGSAARGPVELAGVHISELPDPTPYLEGGELFLTTGMPLSSAAAGTRDYVARLSGRGVRALVLGLGPIHAETPPALRDACEEFGMPLLVVPAQHAFRTVTTGYWDLVAAEGQAGLVRQIGTQTSVVREAAGADGGAGVARLVAQALGSWAAVFPFDGGEPAIWPASAAGVLPALATELRRFSQRGDVGSATFPLHGFDVSAYPIGDGDRAVAAFVVGTTRRFSRTDRQLILTATAALSLRASLAGGTRAAELAIQTALAGLLIADEVTAAQALAAAAGARPIPAALRVFVVAPARGDAETPRTVPAEAALAELVRRDLVTAETAERSRPVLATTIDGCLVALLEAGHDDGAEGEAPHPDHDDGPYALAGSLTGPVPPGSLRSATALALRTARRAPAGTILPAGDSGDTSRGEAAAALLEGYTRAPLVDAVRGYLRHRGSWEHAARDLGVHRNTVRARVRTARETLGLDLDDPDLAAELWIALRDRGSTLS